MVNNAFINYFMMREIYNFSQENLPILNNYSKLCEKIKELENMQENVLHENSLLKQELSKIKTDMSENELLV